MPNHRATAGPPKMTPRQRAPVPPRRGRRRRPGFSSVVSPNRSSMTSSSSSRGRCCATSYGRRSPGRRGTITMRRASPAPSRPAVIGSTELAPARWITGRSVAHPCPWWFPGQSKVDTPPMSTPLRGHHDPGSAERQVADGLSLRCAVHRCTVAWESSAATRRCPATTRLKVDGGLQPRTDAAMRTTPRLVVPQRVLAVKLRTAIDRAMRHPGREGAADPDSPKSEPSTTSTCSGSLLVAPARRARRPGRLPVTRPLGRL